MKLCMERSWTGHARPQHARSEGSVGRVQGVQQVELLAPKDHRSVLNIAFEEIVDIGSGKVNFFPFVALESIGSMLSRSVLHGARGRGMAVCVLCYPSTIIYLLRCRCSALCK
jgi:hypothetical protein